MGRDMCQIVAKFANAGNIFRSEVQYPVLVVGQEVGTGPERLPSLGAVGEADLGSVSALL